MPNIFDDPKYQERKTNAFDDPKYFVQKESDAAAQLKHGTGLAVRSLATGVASLPHLVADAVYGLMNATTGERVPLQSERFQQTLTELGLPEPENKLERIGQTAGSAAIGAGTFTAGAKGAANLSSGPLRMAFQNMARDPMAQAGAAAAGAGTGGLLQEGGAPGWAQVGGAMLGGVVIPTAGGTALAALLRPRTAGGREQIAGDVLRSFATNPEKAASELGNYQPGLLGSVATAGQASRDPGLLGFERFLRGGPGAGRFAEDLTRNNQARIAALEEIAGTGSEAAFKAREKLIPKLDAAMANKTDVSLDPLIYQLDSMGNTPRFTDAYSRAAIQRAKSEIESLGQNAFDPEFLYNGPRKTIADLVSKKFDSLSNRPLAKNEIAAYREILKSLDDTIESGAPGYNRYRTEYAKLSRGAERRQTLEELRSRAEATGSVDLDREMMLQGSRWNTALKKLDEDVAKLSPMQRKTVDSVTEDFKTGMLTGTGGPVGSSTWANINMAHLLGRIAGGGLGENTPKWVQNVADKFAFMVRMPQEDVQRLIIDAMRDPQLARNLLVKANAMSAEPLASKLSRRAGAYGYGAAQNKD